MWGLGLLVHLELSLAEGQAKAVFEFHESGWTESHCQGFLVGETWYPLATHRTEHDMNSFIIDEWKVLAFMKYLIVVHTYNML